MQHLVSYQQRAHPPTPRLKELCNRHGILVIFDEVMCGMGRVGTYHAWQSLGGVAPDLQAIGKGFLGAGYQPLSVVLIGKKVYDMFEEHSRQPKTLVSGHMFQGHSMECAGALIVQKILDRDNLILNVMKRGLLLESLLPEGLLSYKKEYGVSLRGSRLFRTVDSSVLRHRRYEQSTLRREHLLQRGRFSSHLRCCCRHCTQPVSDVGYWQIPTSVINKTR